MRILQIAPRLCWPLDTGAKLRNFHLARVLAERASVSLLAFSDQQPSFPELKEIYDDIITVPRNGYTLSKIVRGALGSTPLPVLNYTSRAMANGLARLLDEKQFDIIQVESVHLINCLPVIRAARNSPVVICDWHNIESELLRQYAARERRIFRTAYARRTAGLMSETERRALREFDAHIVVSKQDAARLRSTNSEAVIRIIENGVDTNYFSQNTEDDSRRSRNRILLVGSMDYHANVDGAVHFAHEVWPQVRPRNPELVFTIVGKDPDPEIRALQGLERVEVTGTVDNVRPFYREAAASVVPLRVGGGSRLKILEAMAAGVPVISTTLGAEGLDVRDGADILIADSASEFAKAIADVVDNEALSNRLVAAGKALVTERYDWSKLGGSLFAICEDLIGTSCSAAI